MDVLHRTKRLVLHGNIEYSRKARDEMAEDNLTEEEVSESLLNAQKIDKIIRSRSRWRSHAHEKM